MNQSNNTPPPTTPNVLIVEDDSFISLFLEKKLVELKFNPHVSSTTKDAQEFLKKEKVDAILLDIIMPDENGFLFLERLKKDPVTANIPVIIVSNLGQEAEIERGKSLGAVDFLIKGNHSPAEIVTRVTEVIEQSRKGTAT